MTRIYPLRFPYQEEDNYLPYSTCNLCQSANTGAQASGLLCIHCDPDSEFHFLKEAELPIDLCFSKKQKGKKIQYYLLTLFDETLPKYRIRKRSKISTISISEMNGKTTWAHLSLSCFLSSKPRNV